MNNLIIKAIKCNLSIPVCCNDVDDISLGLKLELFQ
jgi:hypothetical protein